MWHGHVDANAEDGKETPIHLKKGEIISILAKGWVKFGPDDNTQWADPQSPIPPYGSEYKSDTTSMLVATVGKDTTRYPIGNGKLHWQAPADGVLTFLFADAPGKFGDNSGSFEVEVVRETPER